MFLLPRSKFSIPSDWGSLTERCSPNLGCIFCYNNRPLQGAILGEPVQVHGMSKRVHRCGIKSQVDYLFLWSDDHDVTMAALQAVSQLQTHYPLVNEFIPMQHRPTLPKRHAHPALLVCCRLGPPLSTGSSR